ncbi:DUF6706 family protein [Polaribacter sp. IC073]|uniref:DUF6706 family protein n=1 Tax=Polaribacter sp. IC073 TaxID=2508540 RepID=UPI0011BD774B|nr:DUF6706 family protein [Polaribacter sp. IC073]TXD47342.1 hypothetical protein ES045_12150 [Polaribacter sp. IC073]
MTKRNYIKQKFASVGILLSEADFVDFNISDIESEVDSEGQKQLYALFILKIPSLLLRPSSISEGGVSISRASKADIEAFYSNECKRLGLKNELVLKPKVRFR